MRLVSFIVTVCLAAGHASAQIAFEDESNPSFDEFSRQNSTVLEMIEPDAENEVGQSVGNGQVVDPRLFQGVLRMRTGGTCTASLIGPAVILIAAHCVQEDRRIAFVAGNLRVAGLCVISPTYNPVRHHDDWALCLLERRVSEGTVTFETVDISSRPAEGASVALTGYGCTFRGGPLDGRLRIGFSTVVDRPAGFRREPSAIFTESDVGQGEAFLCPGDSGGPLFVMGDDASGPRRIVGVNSRTTFEYGVSIFSALSSPSGAQFIREFASSTNEQICGVNRELGCK
ncbi:MAG: S1 family peptidase [Boseongicola sp.]|nr:S1 family peptidase [Boseongicola sp.]